MTSFSAAFARQLDALTMAGQDNMARALREVETIQAFVKTEEIVQGHLVNLKSTLARTDAMKREVAALLGHHRAPRQARIISKADPLTKAVEAYREGLPK